MDISNQSEAKYLVGGMDARARFVGIENSTVDCFCIEKQFNAEKLKKNESLFLSICILGECRAFLNEIELDIDILSPYTEFNKRYPTKNQTNKIPDFSGFTRLVSLYPLNNSLIVQGNNTFRLEISGGFYCQKRVYGYPYGNPAVMASIIVKKNNIYKTLTHTDDSFSAYTLPTIEANVYYGETVDLRLVNKRAPLKITINENPSDVKLQEKKYKGDRITQRIHCKYLYKKNDVSIYDIGRNTTFLPVISINNEDGALTKVRFSEIIDTNTGLPDYRTYYGEERMIYKIISDGNPQICRSSFTLFAGRYVCVYGEVQDVWVDEVLPDMSITSTFESSSPVLNGYVNAFIRSALTNFHSGIPSDCPHRERLGYTGDGILTCSSLLFFTDMHDRVDKWLNDIRDCQDKNTGRVPHVAPWIPAGGGPGGWGSAIIFIPWRYYCFYGEIHWLEENYESMKKWIEYLESHLDNGIQNREEPDNWCLGEWCTPSEVTISAPFVNTCMMLEELSIMKKISKILNMKEDQSYFSSLIKTVRDAIIKKSKEDGSFSLLQDHQGGTLFSFDAGLISRGKARKHLSSYESKKIDTGILGTPKLFEQLFSLGLSEIAISLLLQTEYPSFGYMISNGSDTLWEDWSGFDHRPGGVVTSRNHPMFGGAVYSIWEWLVGIHQKDGTAGYKDIIISPIISSQLSYLKCTISLPSGKLFLSWERNNELVHLSIKTPKNAKGIVKLFNQTCSFVGEKNISIKIDTLLINKSHN